MQDSCQVPEQFNKAFFTSLVIESKLDRTLFAAILKNRISKSVALIS